MKLSKPSKRVPTRPQRPPSTTDEYAVDYIDHAPVWPAAILTPGIFRPLQNGAPTAPWILIHRGTFRKCATAFRIAGAIELNIVDQIVYFHLCQLLAAGKGEKIAPEHPQYAHYQQLLGVSGVWSKEPMAVIAGKLSDLAVGVGLSRSGTNAKSVLASLNRLNLVEVSTKTKMPSRGVLEGDSRLIALACADKEVRIVLHFESAFLAQHRKAVAWVNMREQRSLPSKPAKRLHAWLSAWASSKELRLVGLSKLIVNVWGDAPANADIRKDRMRTLRKALKAVGELPGWSCVEMLGSEQVYVRKPRFVGTAAKVQAAIERSKVADQVATPTPVASTTTEEAVTPPIVAATATTEYAERTRSMDSEDLVFSL